MGVHRPGRRGARGPPSPSRRSTGLPFFLFARCSLEELLIEPRAANNKMQAALRTQNQQFFIRDKKKALMDTAPLMALTCAMITLMLFLSQARTHPFLPL